jgi:hypothetical protein
MECRRMDPALPQGVFMRVENWEIWVYKTSGRLLLMRKQLTIRALSVALFGILFGAYLHHTYVRWSQRGMDAFLQFETNHQTHRFERYMAHPRSELVTIVGAVATLMLVAGIYELIVAGVLKLTDTER